MVDSFFSKEHADHSLIQFLSVQSTLCSIVLLAHVKLGIMKFRDLFVKNALMDKFGMAQNAPTIQTVLMDLFGILTSEDVIQKVSIVELTLTGMEPCAFVGQMLMLSTMLV